MNPKETATSPGEFADPWRQPLPWGVEKQYLLDAIAFYEEEKRNPQKPARSAQELMELLDEEIQRVDEREADQA